MSKLLTAQIVIVIALYLVAKPSSSLSKTIYVNALNGNDSECGQQGKEAVPCQSFEMVEELLKQYREDSVRVKVETDIILFTAFQVTSSNIDIVGTSDSDPLNLTYIRCEARTHAGFIVDAVQNFSFINLAVGNCAARLIDSQHPYHFAMMIKSSSGLLLRNVRFENCSKNTGLVLVNNVGSVVLDNTSFLENHPKERKFRVPVSHPGAISIQQNHEKNTERVNYKITRSTFHYNQTPEIRNITIIGNSTTPVTDFIDRGYGGALFVEFGGNTTLSSLIIEDSNFTYNTGSRGGGVYAYYKDNAQNNSISIFRSKFLSNNADISGGGVNFGHYNSPSLYNVFTLTDCRFIKNSALFGAGLTFYSTYSSQNRNDYRTFIVNNSRWEYNTASLSSAVDVLPLKQNIGVQGYLPTPEFENCTFINNIIQTKPRRGHTNHNNVGVFSVTQLKIFFSKHTTFKNNLHSALLLEIGIAEFKNGSVVTFEKNSGFNGGAISMYGFSAIVLNPYSSFNFYRNHASAYGGAIFHKTGDQHVFLEGNSECFLRNTISPMNKYLIQTIKVDFIKNTAGTGGAAMYSTSFRSCNSYCRQFFNEKKHNGDLQQNKIFNCVGVFGYKHNSNNNKKHHLLTTSGWKFKFLDKRSSFSVIPGDGVDLNFTVFDDFHQEVHPLLTIVKEDENRAAQVSVNNVYSLSHEIFPTGTPKASANFTLTAVDVREIYFPFELTLLPCPPGYYDHNNTCNCASGHSGYADIIKCNRSSFQAEYKGDLWIGYIPDNENSSYEDLYFSPCISLLCDGSNYRLPQHRADLNGRICVEHRQGVMCGKCEQHYSTYYHSRNLTCGPEDLCHLGSLFYVLSEIVPMVIFFIVVVTFDLSFTSGRSVGFVFFTQYLNQLTIHINPLFSYLRSPYRIFYGLFNFEFFNIENLSFCLWKRAQIQDILAMKYVTIVVALALVLIFVTIMHNNSCNRLCRLRSKVSTKTSVVNGLSAFLVICYAQCTRTTFNILRYTRLVGYHGKR